MTLLPHWIHVYEKPATGAAFVRRYESADYTHKINGMGWFDTASCDLTVSQAEAELIFENYIGNRVAVYVDNPAEPIWEGYVSTILYTAGGLQFRRSMDEMANRVYTNHDQEVAGVNTTVTSTGSLDTTSEAIYGTKEIAVKGRFKTTATVANDMTRLRNRKVAELAFPQTSVTVKGASNAFIKLEMRGFYDTLTWEKVKNDRGNQDFATLFETDELPALYNASTFFDNTDFTELDVPGVTVRSASNSSSGETVWDLAQDIAEYGDGVDLWIVGITETKSNGKRRMYYRATNKTVEYTALTRDGLRIRNKFGGLLRPWTIKPDRIVQITDILVGWNAIGADPRQTYILSITYKQNANAITWVGEDDTTIEGVMRTFKSQKEFKRTFGIRPNIRVH